MTKTKEIFHLLKENFPLHLVPEWDVTGPVVFLENRTESKILITTDLSNLVVQEAINKRYSLIISYHPPYLRPPRKFSYKEYPALLLTKLIQNNINLFVLHTSLDLEKDSLTENMLSFMENEILGWEIIDRVNENFGFGRICELHHEISLDSLIKRIKVFFYKNELATLKVAYPFEFDQNRKKEFQVKNIVCMCGTGASIIRKCKKPFQVILTGEMNYHDLLEFVSRGVVVILLGHSNSERHFLPTLTRKIRKLIKDTEIDYSKEDRSPTEYI